MDRCTLLFDIYEASIYKSMPFSIQRYRAGSSICLLFLHWSDKSQLLDPATEFWSLSLSGSLYEMVRDVCLCTRYYDPTRVWCVLYDRTGSPYMFHVPHTSSFSFLPFQSKATHKHRPFLLPWTLPPPFHSPGARFPPLFLLQTECQMRHCYIRCNEKGKKQKK